MGFYANISWFSKLPNMTDTSIDVAGSIILPSGLPYHTLIRRKKGRTLDQPHFRNRLFDPQLYLADLDVNRCSKTCANLASYRWFSASVDEYQSDLLNQKEWKQETVDIINEKWPGEAVQDPKEIDRLVRICIDFQRELGCWGIILPAPLTYSSNSDYSEELIWLDSALRYIREEEITIPVFATVALSDIVFRSPDREINKLLDIIVDTISARGVSGVYLTLCQGGESGQTKHYDNVTSLTSILKMVHNFCYECDPKMRVIVNGLGYFGLICHAVGAEIWAGGWYNKLYRFHMDDLEDDDDIERRSLPKYWTRWAMVDISVKHDIAQLSKVGLLDSMKDETPASSGLLLALAKGASVSLVEPWQYRASNVTAAREHFYHSCVVADKELTNIPGPQKLDYIQKLLDDAVSHTQKISRALKGNSLTHVEHVKAWHRAFSLYRQDQAA